jgi:phosphoglycerol transferase MdoB-like AlkP superfamily enzyme
MSDTAVWTVVHGMVFGSVFLLGFSAGFVALFPLRTEWTTAEGRELGARRLPIYSWIMACSLWLTVVTGTLMVYPTYRASPPDGIVELADYPRSLLLEDPALSVWHHFGMEWKEHIAWLAPILVTVAAFIVTRYRMQLAEDAEIRKAVIMLFTFAFFAAGVAGLLGALINKVAPIP